MVSNATAAPNSWPMAMAVQAFAAARSSHQRPGTDLPWSRIPRNRTQSGPRARGGRPKLEARAPKNLPVVADPLLWQPYEGCQSGRQNSAAPLPALASPQLRSRSAGSGLQKCHGCFAFCVRSSININTRRVHSSTPFVFLSFVGGLQIDYTALGPPLSSNQL